MGLFTNPLSYAGYPPNVTGTPSTQNSTVRAATTAEAEAGVLNYVYISPATMSSDVAAEFASPPALGSTTPAAVTATTLTSTTSSILHGNPAGTAPAAGNIGEQIRSAVASGSAVTFTTSTDIYNITSIVLTAGTWDISAVGQISGATQTQNQISITTTTAANGTLGDNSAETPTTATSASAVALFIPAWRLNTSGATVFLTGTSTFSGSAAGYGRISATRVA